MTAPLMSLVGVGFGPANLSLALALKESGVDRGVMFMEMRNKFAWHPGMMLPKATMQISYLKDLATPRNPCSFFTFTNYLKQRGRLDRFINLQTFYPTRLEFNDYLEWAAAQVDDFVLYRTEVVGLEPVDLGTQRRIRVHYRGADGSTRWLDALNVSVATGHRPYVPSVAKASLGSSVFHASEFVDRIGQLEGRPALRFAIIGGGQSAAEIANCLYHCFPQSEISWYIKQFALQPMDDTPFVNELFSEWMIDHWFHSPSRHRRELLGSYRQANYAAVDAELIDDLYRGLYDDSVCGRSRLRIHNLSELVSAAVHDNCVRLVVKDLVEGSVTTSTVDVAVLATGYTKENYSHLLRNFDGYLERDDHGRYAVDRHYRIRTASASSANIFVLGCNEDTHGIGDSLLSNVATRADDVLRRVFAADRPARDGEDGLIASEDALEPALEVNRAAFSSYAAARPR
ncbi:MAG: lysine N(6)-hydroxylase/L-ornithine N(5)-oxygenase family protein [Hyphomicrobiales bacterium]|nr:lysine N(6)-hydroxylase/L-ornithine N(5)-oxygenase family protein [Hyphomicrobiales bacterium]